MTAALAGVLAVLLLAGPGDAVPAARAPAPSGGGEGGVAAFAQRPAHAKISAVRADFDRREGVAMFDGGVLVEYGDSYVMRAGRVFAFFAGSNELDRVVATGGVALTNETRSGSCASAVFRRREGEVEMYGGEDGTLASLSTGGADGVSGRVIRFWLDAEQVEVFGSEVRMGREKGRAIGL